nr:2-oxoacid:ferredoxin oxidoreductase subunit beta [Actinomycetes bacterium]
IHALRRNVNLKILLFNNRIYGLTKGQYSPTSEHGKVTKSTPQGSLDYAFNPVSVALGAEATFVARAIDSDRKHLTEVLRAAAAHEGSALVEIYQNCNIFNDGAFEPLKENDVREDHLIRLEHGQPIIFGNNHEKCVIRDSDGHLQVVNVEDVDPSDVIIFDSHAKDPGLAFGLSRLYNPRTLTNTPIGIFRDVTHREAYDRMAQQQIADVIESEGRGDLRSLLHGSDTWTIN